MNKEFIVAVKALIKNENNEFLVLTRPGDKRDKYLSELDLPGGKVDFGETLEEALSREIFEETGIRRYRLEKLINADSFITHVDKQLTVITYLVHTKEEKVTLSHEHVGYNWLSAEKIQDFPKWIREIISKS